MTRPVFAFCFDENYVEIAVVAVGSLFLNAKSGVLVYLIVPPEIESYVRETWASARVPEGSEIRVITSELPLMGKIPYAYHFNESTFLRLLLPELLKEEDRVVYMDCDLLVLSDCQSLFDADLHGRVIGAVQEIGAAKFTRVPMVDRRLYFNAGVMLMDLATLRRENFTERAVSLYASSPETFTFCDQCVINHLLEGRIWPLDRTWNRAIRCSQMDADGWREAVEGTNVVHFIANHKPWTPESYREATELWFKYREKVLFTYFAK